MTRWKPHSQISKSFIKSCKQRSELPKIKVHSPQFAATLLCDFIPHQLRQHFNAAEWFEITRETNYLVTEKCLMLRRALRRAKGVRVAINKFWKVHLVTRNSLLIPTPQAIEAHTVGGGWVPKKLYLCYYVKLQQVMTLHPGGRSHTGAVRWCLALNTLTVSTRK